MLKDLKPKHEKLVEIKDWLDIKIDAGEIAEMHQHAVNEKKKAFDGQTGNVEKFMKEIKSCHGEEAIFAKCCEVLDKYQEHKQTWPGGMYVCVRRLLPIRCRIVDANRF